MSEPLTNIVQLLEPRADFFKLVEAVDPWRVSRSEQGRPFFCVVIAGAAKLHMSDTPVVNMGVGDFLLIPALQHFTMLSSDASIERTIETAPVRMQNGLYRLGPRHAPVSTRLLIGYCQFRSPDKSLLLALLPRIIHVSDNPRLASLVELIADETRADRPGRDVVVARLLEVTLIEALRARSNGEDARGLVSGLSDPRLAVAIRKMHEEPAQPWTSRLLAKEAGLSRTVFFERFRARVGVAPMEHLAHWRMALAKKMLRERLPLDEVAARIGYGSTSAFITAFRRFAGTSPRRFTQQTHQPD